MSSEANPIYSRGFGDWYVDESIPGHLPLAPSIFVGRTYKWIFSTVNEKGCEAVMEVFARTLLFAVLPFIAVFALVCIPLGLVTKSLGGCFHSPPPMPLNPDPTRFPLNKSLSADSAVTPPVRPVVKRSGSDPLPLRLGIDRLSGENSAPSRAAPSVVPSVQDPLVATPASTPPTQPKVVYSTEDLERVQPAETTLDAVCAILASISVRKIDIDTVKRAKTLLEGDVNIRLLLMVPPNKQVGDDDPIQSIVNKTTYATARIQSLEFLYHYYSKTLVEEGEIPVPDNGNCIFQAFLEHGAMNGSTLVDPHKERLQTMEWIRENYNSDPILQRHLVNSIAEHYQTKMEKLEKEQEDLQSMLSNPSLSLGAANKSGMQLRLQTLPQEIDAVLLGVMAQICEAFGQAHSETINFLAVEGLVEGYLADLSQDGVHGGAAELYALSCRHKVCVCVHRKNGHAIDEKPYETINEQFKDKSSRHFTHTRNHYNAYCPVM